MVLHHIIFYIYTSGLCLHLFWGVFIDYLQHLFFCMISTILKGKRFVNITSKSLFRSSPSCSSVEEIIRYLHIYYLVLLSSGE